MAKKSFKGGLNSILSSSEFFKDKDIEENAEKKEISEDEKHFLVLKIEKLEKELFYWRTGKLTPEKFIESLKKHGLKYDSETNIITE